MTIQQELFSSSVIADVLWVVELFSFETDMVAAYFAQLDHFQEEKGRWQAEEPMVKEFDWRHGLLQ